MAEYLIQGETLSGIAEAIRGKTGGTEAIPVSAMAEQIAGITGGGVTEKDLFAAQKVSGFAYADYLGAFVRTYAPMPFSLVSGKEYVVVWDNETFKRTAFSFAAADGAACVGLGNQLATGGADSGEPFCIVCDTTNNFLHFCATDTKAEHDVRVYQLVSGGSSDDVRYVTFMSSDGTVEYGKKAVAVGDDCADPIARGVFDTPTKESTAQYNYTFAGWATTVNGALDSNALKAVTEDRTVYANYISAIRYYTITYYDSDGTTVLKTETMVYGSTPNYIPDKREGYTFEGWIPDLAVVTKNANYTAQFIESLALEDASWATIAEKSANGTANKIWSVGDVKTFARTRADGTTENVEAVIIGFNHDTLSDGTGMAGITFQTKITFGTTETLKWNETEKTSDNVAGANIGGWELSDIRNTHLVAVYNGLPADLAEIIKTVNKISDLGGSNQTANTTQDKLWLLSHSEIIGNDSSLAGLMTTSHYPTAQQGSQYEYCRNSPYDYITDIMNFTEYTGTAERFWLRSTTNGNNYFVLTGYRAMSSSYENGKVIGYDNARATPHYLSFGFCI